MEEAGEDVDFRKPTFTNEPDDGLDIELKAPHNTGERLECIARQDTTIPPPSNSKINIRIDHKYYNDKIGKAMAQKFVNDIPKNPDDSEHWITGGKGLTSGAQRVLKEAQAPTRYFSDKDLDVINAYFNEVDNENDNES